MPCPINKCDLRLDNIRANDDPSRGEIWQPVHIGRDSQDACRMSIRAGIKLLAIARIHAGIRARDRGDRDGQIARMREALDLEKIADHIRRARLK